MWLLIEAFLEILKLLPVHSERCLYTCGIVYEMVQKGHLVLNGQEEALNVEKDLVLKKG